MSDVAAPETLAAGQSHTTGQSHTGGQSHTRELGGGPGAAPRPMLVAALALAAGSAAAAPGLRLGEREGALALSVALGLGALAAARRAPRHAGIALLALAPAGAWRAAAEPGLQGPNAPIGGTLLEGPTATAFGAERWRLSSVPMPIELAPGIARQGERVTIDARSSAVQVAAGPHSDAHARTPITLRPRADELRRVESARRIEELTRQGPALASALADRSDGANEAGQEGGHGAREARRSTLAGLREHGLARLAGDAAPARAGLLAALLLGSRDGVSPSEGEVFTRTGTRHLLALSGLHFGLVAWLLGRPLARGMHRVLVACLCFAAAASAPLRVGRRLAAALAWTRRQGPGPLLGLAALAFVPLAGSGAPAARAAVALALASFAPVVRSGGSTSGRRPDPLSLWSVALALELLDEPSAALNVGVQLSYGATFALIVATRPTFERCLACLPGGGRIAPVDRGGRRRAALWRVPAERALRSAIGALAVGGVATAATLPFTWARFGEWSPVGILATPVIMPCVAAALVTGYGWLLAPDVIPRAAPGWSVELMVRALEWFDRAPLSPMVLPGASTAWLYAATALLICALREPPGGARARAGLAAGGLALLAPMLRPADEPLGLELVALDVGRGRALLLRAPECGVWLIDAGSGDRAGVARRAIAPTLRAWRTRTLGVVLTTGDRAHGGDLPWLTERFRVHTWCGAPPEAVGARTAPDTRRFDVDGRGGVAELALGGGAAPVIELVRSGGEDVRSLVVRYHGSAIAVVGDLDEGALGDLLARGWLDDRFEVAPQPAPAAPHRTGFDVVVLPSNGGAGRWLGALLDATRPRQAWSFDDRAGSAAAELARRAIRYADIATQGPQRFFVHN
ncbi:MAG: ComEC/Rec2 family competence protein [Planctomycetota bacterium]